MGFPIRTFSDQSSFAAPQDLSQRTTSFIASWHQGIHQIPLFHLITRIINIHSHIIFFKDRSLLKNNMQALFAANSTCSMHRNDLPLSRTKRHFRSMHKNNAHFFTCPGSELNRTPAPLAAPSPKLLCKDHRAETYGKTSFASNTPGSLAVKQSPYYWITHGSERHANLSAVHSHPYPDVFPFHDVKNNTHET